VNLLTGLLYYNVLFGKNLLQPGQYGQIFDLECDPEKVHSVQVKLKKGSKSCLKRTCCFFRSSRRANPNGDLPEWLVYHPKNNSLEVIAPGRSDP